MLREEELIRIARMRRAKPWQEEMRYIQALILYAVADWPLVLKGGTYLWSYPKNDEQLRWERGERLGCGEAALSAVRRGG